MSALCVGGRSNKQREASDVVSLQSKPTLSGLKITVIALNSSIHEICPNDLGGGKEGERLRDCK